MSMQQTSIADGAATEEKKYQILNNNNNNEADGNRSERVLRLHANQIDSIAFRIWCCRRCAKSRVTESIACHHTLKFAHPAGPREPDSQTAPINDSTFVMRINVTFISVY